MRGKGEEGEGEERGREGKRGEERGGGREGEEREREERKREGGGGREEREIRGKERRGEEGRGGRGGRIIVSVSRAFIHEYNNDQPLCSVTPMKNSSIPMHNYTR